MICCVLFLQDFMGKDMIERKDERFGPGQGLSPEDFSIEFEFLDNVRGRITDISLNGVGFEIDEISASDMENLAGSEDYFIKIFVENELFLAGVRNRWHVKGKAGSAPLYRGGVQITIMSPEDLKRLSGLIRRLRDG